MLEVSAAEVITRQWTPADIYAEGRPESYRTVPPYLKGYDFASEYRLDIQDRQSTFTAEFIAAIRSESSWAPDPLPRFDPLLQEQVGRKQVKCPHCDGTFFFDRTYRGHATGVVIILPSKCPCKVYRYFWAYWGDPVRVPSRFRLAGATGPVKPCGDIKLSLARQAAILKTINEDTERSYFLFGPPDTGKTYILTALYRYALSRAAKRRYDLDVPVDSVWRISASVLLDEHVAWEFRHGKPEGSVKCPYMLTSMIHSAVGHGFRPCLFLDEIDKIVPTEFKLKRLMQIVDAVYEAEGQVVATSNETVAALIVKWGENEAGTLLRRIGSGNRAKAIHFVESQV